MEKEQFEAWLADPTTIEVFGKLREMRDVDVENLASGNTLGADIGETSQLTARVVGNLEMLEQLIDSDTLGRKLGIDYDIDYGGGDEDG